MWPTPFPTTARRVTARPSTGASSIACTILLDRGAVATKDVESSEADYNDARTDVQNSLQPLRIFGINQQEIDQAEQQGTAISTELAVRSPITGEVVQKLVSPGMVIQAGTTVCFQLSNTSTVWVQGHIFDRDLPSVRNGDPVDETNPASARTFRGVVNYVGAFVDPATRTTPVRIVTQNPQGMLKKDMFVEAVHSHRRAGQRSGRARPPPCCATTRTSRSFTSRWNPGNSRSAP